MRKVSGCIAMMSGILILVGNVEAAQNFDQGEKQKAKTVLARGDVIAFEKISSLTREQIATHFANEKVPGVPRYGVVLFRVTYQTIDYNGEPTVASGAIAFPDSMDDPAPLLSFQHGTVVARHRVPSVTGFDLVSMGLGSSGYITVLPDYLGLGQSEGFHPYVHAQSLATSVVDMIRAARLLSGKKGKPLNGQLFLMGYSEGGYATMAAHREIEQYHDDEIRVTASAPMAGPYNLSEVMVDQILEEKAYPSPGYLPFTLLAYDMVYDIYDDVRDVIQSDYVEAVELMEKGETGFKKINRLLPEVPRDMLTVAFIDAFRSDPNHPLRDALKENDVHNWAPRSPMRLYHCVDDDQVSYRNAEIALKAYQNHGADHVELARLTFGDHNECAPPSIFLGKLWFDGFVEDKQDRVYQANVQIIRAGSY